MGSSSRKARTASLHDDAYASFVAMLVESRVRSGLKQQAVADELGWNQSIVSKIETKQRRVDVIELIQMAKVIGFDPAKLVKEMQKKIRACEFN